MSTKIAKSLLIIYQGIFLSKNATCRYSPTCSQYLVDAIEKYGPFKGSIKGIVRILSCHPFSHKPYLDEA